jgi:hypothetical protein
LTISAPRLKKRDKGRTILLAATITICSGIPLQAQTASAPTAPVQPGQLLHNTVSAPPLTAGGKFHYRILSLFGPRDLIGLALGAGIATGFEVPKEWGRGGSGYGLHYANGLGIALTRQSFAWGLDSAFHEDPRYFPSQEHGFIRRVNNVFKQVVICKNDEGGDTVAYGRLISAFAAAQVAGAWQPPSTQGFGNGLERGAIILAADATISLVQEFIPFMRPGSLRHRH